MVSGLWLFLFWNSQTELKRLERQVPKLDGTNATHGPATRESLAVFVAETRTVMESVGNAFDIKDGDESLIYCFGKPRPFGERLSTFSVHCTIVSF